MKGRVKIFAVIFILLFNISILSSCNKNNNIYFEYGIGEILNDNEDLIMIIKDPKDLDTNNLILDSKYDDSFFTEKSLIVIGLRTTTSGEKINNILLNKKNKQLTVGINANIRFYDALGFVSVILEVAKVNISNVDLINVSTNLNRY